MVTVLYLLTPDRLEAYPTCLGSVARCDQNQRMLYALKSSCQ